MSKKDKCSCGCGEELEKEEQTSCGCGENCTCGEECNCSQENRCNENCSCGEETECECDENCGCDHECKCEENKEYLRDLLRVQAEFDNYRKRMTSALGDARQDGFMDAICQFLPALDSFKMATDMITDKNTLMGIKFIEKGILDTLAKMGVDEIDTTGKFNPELHQAIDTENDDNYESGDIIKVATFNACNSSSVLFAASSLPA